VASEATTTSREKVPERVNHQELTPAANNAAVFVPAGPSRTTSSDTLSITNKGNPMDWEDDDDGAKTAIAKPNELPGLLALRTSRRSPAVPAPFVPEPHDAPVQSSPSLAPVDSFDDLSMVRPRRTGLLVALAVLAALAIGGLLVLFDVIPLPRLPGSGHKVGLHLSPLHSEGKVRA
jgi:hypothetical protein